MRSAVQESDEYVQIGWWWRYLDPEGRKRYHSEWDFSHEEHKPSTPDEDPVQVVPAFVRRSDLNV